MIRGPLGCSWMISKYLIRSQFVIYCLILTHFWSLWISLDNFEGGIENNFYHDMKNRSISRHVPKTAFSLPFLWQLVSHHKHEHILVVVTLVAGVGDVHFP